MNERRKCAACGREGYDVSPRIVELEDGTYASQLRCVNTQDCQDRQAQGVLIPEEDG